MHASAVMNSFIGKPQEELMVHENIHNVEHHIQKVLNQQVKKVSILAQDSIFSLLVEINDTEVAADEDSRPAKHNGHILLL